MAVRKDDRLQPSLLDRLTDDAPDKQDEYRLERVLSLGDYKKRVYRDIDWLLNATSLECVQDLDDYPQVKKSVLNYGIHGLAGTSASSIDVPQIEEVLRNAVLFFEPRILPKTLRVKVSGNERMDHNAVNFDISGKLWALPIPVELYLKTELDLDGGNIRLKDENGTVVS
jgi:type VI secretion system protein ImpF